MHPLHVYKHGRCHLFALALNDVFGYDIHALWDLEPMDDECNVLPTSLVHMYCIAPDGHFLDAEGRFEAESLKEFPCNEEDFVAHSREHVHSLISAGILSAPDPEEISALTLYIKANHSIYHPPRTN